MNVVWLQENTTNDTCNWWMRGYLPPERSYWFHPARYSFVAQRYGGGAAHDVTCINTVEMMKQFDMMRNKPLADVMKA